MLERAGADDADMIIAVTLIDEVNMVACQVAIRHVQHAHQDRPRARPVLSLAGSTGGTCSPATNTADRRHHFA
jgi:hypothetical protein